MPSCSYPERQALRSSAEEIFSLVEDNATPKQWADWLRPPMEHAAAKGDLGLVTLLLKAGGTGVPGPRGCRGRTLLDAAAEGGNDKVVSALLRAGARPDVSVRSSSKRRSALHRAALHGHEAAARVLMMAGADVGSLDTDKRGPLHLAVRAGHEQLVCSLLLGGASPSAIDKSGNSPLHLAAWRGHAGIASALLLKGADKNALDREGRSPLHLTAEHGHRGTADALLAAGADVALRYGENELSALDSAASYGHVNVLRALIQHGVDVNDADSTGYTALHMAADNNEASAVLALIEGGADIESQDLHMWTPLHCASRYNGCREAMLALLDHGADVHARESSGENCLHIAALYLAEEAAELLLRWGADEATPNGDGHTPVEIIGAYAPPGDDDVNSTTDEQREEAVDRLRGMLISAPADRAWRRRGWVLLCRNRFLNDSWRVSEAKLLGGLKQQQQQQQRRHHAESPVKKVSRVAPVASTRDGNHGATGGGVSSRGGTRKHKSGEASEDKYHRRDFDGVFSRLVGLAEEDVFRQIVGFL